jgi:hypothetical protein
LGTILRWFYDGGTRHRAYLRHGEEPVNARLELVIGAGRWQAAVRVAPETSLDDYSEQRLAEIARELRSREPVSDPVPGAVAACA